MNPLLGSRHSSLVTCHSSLVTRHSSLGTPYLAGAIPVVRHCLDRHVNEPVLAHDCLTCIATLYDVDYAADEQARCAVCMSTSMSVCVCVCMCMCM